MTDLSLPRPGAATQEAVIADARRRQRRRRRRASIGAAIVVAATAVAVSLPSGRGGGSSPSAAVRPGLSFVPASPALLAQCRETARVVGYPVPCPTRVPAGLVQDGGVEGSGCGGELVAPGGFGACARYWRGWVIGSGRAGDEQVAITASPRPLASAAHLVDGPSWYPTAHVVPLGRLTVRGWRMRAIFVPAATNDGSAFLGHVALVWTTGGHTYGIGFADVHGIAAALRLDAALARGLVLTRG